MPSFSPTLRSVFAVPFAMAAATLVAPRPVAAQGRRAGSIDGVIVTPTGAPLSDVTVYAPALRRGTLSQGGRFHLANLPAGPVRLVVQRVGLVMDTATVTVLPDATVPLRVTLREAATVVAPVVVSATRELQRRSEGSATIDALGSAEIRQTHPSHPKELMNRLAGVHVSELSGEGHSMSIRQPITTKPMYLYLEDGVPTRATGFFNHNALYEVNLPQAGGVEVIKGPGTALYGSDAIGGVVNVLTRPAPLTAAAEATVERGSFGYERLLASGGSTWGANGVRADINVTHGDNWKSEAPFDRQTGTLRWDTGLGSSDWSVKTVLTGTNVSQQDVPALSRALFDTATSTNLAPIASRRVKALRASTELTRERRRSLLSLTAYGRLNDMQLVPSWQLSYDPQTYETSNASAGFLARYRRDFSPLDARLIVGLDGDWSPGRFEAARAVTRPTGPRNAWQTFTRGETQYDYDVTFAAASPYLHAELSPLPGLRLDAGIRADLSGYEYHTRLAPVDTGAHRRPGDTRVGYRHLSPKLGAAYDLGAGQSLFASYRHGFRAPSQGQLFTQGSAEHTVDLRPVTVDSWEVGFRGLAGARLVYQLAAYDMTIRDDIVTYTTEKNSREARNAGRTRHRGIEASTGLAVTSALRLDVAWSVSSQRYADWTPQAARPAANGKPAVAEVSYAGHAIELAPRDLGSVLVTYAPARFDGARAEAEWSHTGGYATDPGNTHSYGGHEQLNLRVSAPVTPRAELFARVVNLTNRKYAEVLSYDNFLKEQYTPGAPRSVVLGMRVGR